ncbi:hypothetical protein CEXT_393181 [Caerostris extrusa]|uniref:Uncharacterized protein n=1 Tax=Caerostris extrusa TaxID=172846 RepID=A0AAV4NG65_CAEEX|nr:hypothetical protein CEXT_393181 [Caerostris extrusa]
MSARNALNVYDRPFQRTGTEPHFYEPEPSEINRQSAGPSEPGEKALKNPPNTKRDHFTGRSFPRQLFFPANTRPAQIIKLLRVPYLSPSTTRKGGA